MLDIEPTSGTVTVGPREHLRVDALAGVKPLWAGRAPDGILSMARRAARRWRRARGVVEVGDSDSWVEPRDPAYGIAPGQACVIYDGTRVVGSATIAETRRVQV